MRASLVILLAAMGMLGPLGIDMYLPAFPVIGHNFAIEPIGLQLTLTFYLACLAAMMLFYGTLSDAFGRRKVLLCSTGLYLVGCLVVVCAHSVDTLLVGRVLQGLAAGAGGVVGRTVIQDLTSGPATLKAMSQVIMAFSLAPAVAPVMGGWILEWLGWRGIFAFQACFAALLWLWCLLGLPETLQVDQRQPFHYKTLLKRYGYIGCDWGFLLPVWAGSFAFLVFSLYIGAATAFINNLLKLPATAFGWLFIPLVTGMMLGSACSARLAGRWTREWQLVIGYTVLIAAGLLNVLHSSLTAPALPWSVAPLGIASFGLALINPCLTLMALDRYPHQRGLAGSLLSFIQTLAFAGVTGLLAPLVSHSALALALTLLGGSLCSAVCCWAGAQLHSCSLKMNTALNTHKNL